MNDTVAHYRHSDSSQTNKQTASLLSHW